jgi:hypothetical protein
VLERVISLQAAHVAARTSAAGVSAFNSRQLLDMASEIRDREALDRSQAMADSHANSLTQAKFREVFAPFGETVPQPAAGENPSAYVRRCVRLTRDKLSSADDRPIGDGFGSTTVGQVAELRGVDRSMPDGVLVRVAEMCRAAGPRASQ